MSKEIGKQAIVTDHGSRRIKDRLGLSKKIADKVSQKALENGVSHSETKGSFKKYIDALYLKHKKANNIKIYHRKIYLFRNEVLITVLNLPNKYSVVADKLQRIKNQEKEKTKESQ
ncbi:gp136 [Bacillus phage G]|uniref:Gp136 n=1 Tax=Bacillus phage G TaxID=2884420 RepID=G3MBK2_9CAUD|nr:gp136 [Bacillus phage G]AEO93398.1 gp136 [Bacillus phage G]